MTKRPFHPLAFALFPVLSLASANVGYAAMGDVIASALVVALIALLVGWILARVFKDSDKAAVITSVMALLFFSFGHVSGLQDLYPTIFRQRYVIPGYFLSFLGIVLFLSLRKFRFERATGLMNVVGGTLLLVAAAGLVSSCSSPKAPLELGAMLESDDVLTLSQRPSSPGAKPDVYYFILDGYARADVIKEGFGYDNEPFQTKLRSLGFQIPANSHTNYTKTDLSIPSTLSLSLLKPEFAKQWHSRYGDLTRLVQSSVLAEFFRSQGYEVVHYDSGNGFSRTSKVADKVVPNPNAVPWLPQGSFSRALIGGSMLKPFVMWGLVQDQRATTLSQLDAMDNSEPGAKPRFVMVHILCPHDPYVFTPDGGKQALLVNATDGYRHNLIYLNSRLERIFERLVKRPNPPIVVVHGDHGWAPDGVSEQDKVRYWTRNFIAVHSPEEKAKLWESITPVNLWRAVLNGHFDAGLSYVDDRSFYARPDQHEPIEVKIEGGMEELPPAGRDSTGGENEG